MGKIRLSRMDATSGRFPENCMICVDRPSVHIERTTMTYYPPWTYIGFLLGLWPVIILMYIFRKQADVSIHLCEECRSRWKSLTAFGCLVAFISFALFFAMIISFAEDQPVIGLLALIALIAIPIYYIFAHNNKYAITPEFIDDSQIVLRLPNDRYQYIYENFVSSTPAAGTHLCNNCGFTNIEGARFCEKCGESL